MSSLHRLHTVLLSSVLACMAVTAPALAQETSRIRGTITAISGSILDVTARSGEKVSIAMAPDVRITAVIPAKLSDVATGSYIGTAAMPQPDGTLRALEVHVFPESMRGVGEGYRPFDLAPDSSMTNGTVGTVSNDTSGPGGRTLEVAYKGGQKTVVIPPNVPVVTFAPGNAAELTPGAHVIVMASRGADGKVSTKQVQVGLNGLVPPM